MQGVNFKLKMFYVCSLVNGKHIMAVRGGERLLAIRTKPNSQKCMLIYAGERYDMPGLDKMRQLYFNSQYARYFLRISATEVLSIRIFCSVTDAWMSLDDGRSVVAVRIPMMPDQALTCETPLK